MVLKRFLGFIGLIMLLALITISLPHPPANAAVTPDQARIAKFYIGQKYYEVDGQKIDMDAAPYIKDGRTMIPVRYLAYSLGIPESDVKWYPNSQSIGVTRGTEKIGLNIGDTYMGVNGRPVAAKLDVVPEIVPPGRTMIPYRAVAQALGAMVFWDANERSVTVETWRDVPEPVKQTTKKVTVYKNSNTADVIKLDGTSAKVTTDRPVMITDPRDGGFDIDTIEWFKVWGVPESSMLCDPVRGGLVIRGASGDYPSKASGYLYFYAGDKFAWNNFYEKTTVSDKSLENNNLDGRICAGYAAKNATYYLFGKTGQGEVPIGGKTAWTELNAE